MPTRAANLAEILHVIGKKSSFFSIHHLSTTQNLFGHFNVCLELTKI